MTVLSQLYISVENILASLTPSVSPSPEAGLPATNLTDSKRNKVCRVTGSPDPIVITAGSGTQYTMGCFALWGWNFASDVTVRIRLYSEDGQTGSVVYDSTALTPHVIIPWGDMLYGPDPWGDVYTTAPPELYAVFFDEVVAKSYQVDIVNPTATSVDIGLIFGGWAWTPTINMDLGQWTDHIDDSKQTRTAGAGLVTQAVDSYKHIGWSLSRMPKTDRETLAHLLETAGKDSDILMSLDPTETTRELIENQMICRRVSNNRATRSGLSFRSTSVEFAEI